MIDKLKYEDILALASELKKQVEVVNRLAKQRSIQDLQDFVATVDGYAKFLENMVNMNKDADEALKELIQTKKNSN